MLQPIRRSVAVKLLAFAVIAATSFSFAPAIGGDSFEVYLNNKLAFQQYVTRGESVKSLQLDQPTGEIEVYYSHCGQTGTNRTITIRDGQNKVLKEWKFQDTPGAKSSMTCNVKDVIGLQKLSAGNTLNLYYSSHELPGGRLLAAIFVSNTARATK